MGIFGSFFKKYPQEQSGAPSKDLVCGMNPTDGITLKYQDVSYKFCSDHCKDQFEGDPAAYI